MGRKTPPFINCPDMTTAKFWGTIRSDLRKRWMYFPERKKALIAARVGKLVNERTGRKCIHVKCTECEGLFLEKECDVDHKIDVGSLKCFEDMPGFMDRLFCKSEDLKILCKACHQEKTNAKRRRKK